MRSIFIEPQYEIKYELEKLLSRHDNKMVISPKKSWSENKEIYVCNIDRPILSVNEMFFLQHINKYVTIQRIIRTSENEVIYLVEDNTFITDEEKANRIKLEEELFELNEYEKVIKKKDDEISRLNGIIYNINDIVHNKVFVWTSELNKWLKEGD